MEYKNWKERKIRDINSPIKYETIKKYYQEEHTNNYKQNYKKKDTFIGPLYPIKNDDINNTDIEQKSVSNSCKCIIL